MKCPHCPVELESFTSRGVELDRCGQCNGIWFDREELGKFNRFDVDFPLRSDKPVLGKFTALHCPRCNAFMTRLRYTPGGSLEVERCITCKGVWIDAKEIRAIRRLLTQKLLRRRESRLLDQAARREQEMWEMHMATVAEEEQEDHVSANRWLLMFLTGLPLEVHNPTRRFPWAVIGLIAVNVLVYVVEQLVTPQSVVRYSFIPSEFRRWIGVHHILSAMFMHANFIHLAGNMYFLY